MTGLGILFASVTDGRASNARHYLADILLIAFAATLCGAETCVDIAAFGRAKEDLLRKILQLKHGIPSHDTFSRVFCLLDPLAFEAAFRSFMTNFATTLASQTGIATQIIAIDGKTLRGAVDSASRTTPLHLVTAWAAEQRLVLCQRVAKQRSEVTAAREIIALLDLTGTIVTADALHGNRATAAAIQARGGDYALVIKGNRGPMHREAQRLLADLDPGEAAFTQQSTHGRYEERRAWVVPVPGWDQRYGFAGLTAMVRLDSLRRIGQKEQLQTRYIALSCMLEPTRALHTIRTHWSIENQQHWMLDVAFNEDRISTRNDNTAQNLALIRRIALNVLQHDKNKASLRVKIKQAGWQDSYLLTLITQMR